MGVNLTRTEIQAALGARWPDMTKKQKEVANLVYEGLRNRQIAEVLFVSEKTVKFHTGNIFDKCQVKNRRELILLIDKVVRS